MESKIRAMAIASVGVIALGGWTAPRTVDSIGDASRAPGDACALLTPAQVNAALGTEVAPGKRLVPSTPRICVWAPPAGPTIDGKKLVLSPWWYSPNSDRIANELPAPGTPAP